MLYIVGVKDIIFHNSLQFFLVTYILYNTYINILLYSINIGCCPYHICRSIPIFLLEMSAELSSRRSPDEEPNETEEVEDGAAEDSSPSSLQEERKELTAAVEKIYQLREIIRGLETELETRAGTERAAARDLAELRTALTEALVAQQAVQEELDHLRSTSTDQDVIDLVEGLKEQLNSKTQELQKHRAVHQHLHDVKVTIVQVHQHLHDAKVTIVQVHQHLHEVKVTI